MLNREPVYILNFSRRTFVMADRYACEQDIPFYGLISV
jgi:hypothetical protein